MTREEILKTEYDYSFDKLRQDMMAMSFYKYGHVEDNAKNGTTDFLKSLERRYEAFKTTRNTEFLADISNFCMMIYMYPQYFDCHYKPTDGHEAPGINGMSVQELKDWSE